MFSSQRKKLDTPLCLLVECLEVDIVLKNSKFKEKMEWKKFDTSENNTTFSKTPFKIPLDVIPIIEEMVQQVYF